MIFHVNAYAILFNSLRYDPGLEGTSNKTGYLHAFSDLSSPIQVSNNSALLLTSNLAKLCSILGFLTSFPLYKLEKRTHAASEILYQVDRCTKCYDLYLECNSFPFRLDPPGDLRVFFQSNWSAMCVRPELNMRTAKLFCRYLHLPQNNITIFQGTRGEYQHSYELGGTCSGSICRLDLLPSSCSKFAAMGCNKIVSQFQLVQGSEVHSGLVQLLSPYNGWKNLSSTDISSQDVMVMCRTLGFASSNGNFYHFAVVEYGAAGRINMNPMECHGNESRVENCPGYNGTGYDYKNGHHILGISCTSASEQELRVTGGYDKVSGRLEVYHQGKWGMICNTNFGTKEVKAACSTITDGRIKSGRIVQMNNFYSRLSEIWLDGVSCPSETTEFSTCNHNPWGETSCEISDVVYIQCSEEELQLRLKGSEESTRPKTLEVFHNGEWGTICYRNAFGETEAMTACNTLGLPSLLAAWNFGSPYDHNSRVWLDGVDCGTVKGNLHECGVLDWGKLSTNCYSRTVVRLSCPDLPDTSNTKYRLEGRGSNIGGAEVQYRGIWRAVCVRNPDRRHAEVMCRSLGLPTEHAIIVPSYKRSAFMATIWVTDVMCQGHEANLFECDYNQLEKQYISCPLDQMLIVACPSIAPSDDYPLRLAGTLADHTSGRVEIQALGIWGRVCIDDITIDDNLKVMCRQLGVEPTEDTKKLDAKVFGETTGMVSWLVSARCNGMESDLADCNHFAVSPGSCSDYSDLSIQCGFVRTSLVGPIVGGTVGGCCLIFFGSIVYCLIYSRCKKKKYAAPEGGRAPVGARVDRLGGIRATPNQTIAPVNRRRFADHSLHTASRQPPAYTGSQHNYEMRPMTPGQPVYVIPVSQDSIDRQPLTSSPKYDTAPSIASDPPNYDDLFPTTQEQTEMNASDV